MHRRHVPAALAALLPAAGAVAQSFPSAKPITWVVPFPPGGVTDTTSRVIAKRLGEVLGQQVVIENRPGAGGSVGTESVARATPDGYTVLYATSGTMASNLALYKNLKYNPLRDFVPVHGMLLSPTIMLVESGRPWKTVADVVNEAKASPGKLNYGSAGVGTGTHLTGELFKTEAGLEITHVPYKGTAPALQDLLGGRVDMMFDYLTPMLPQIKAGKLRPLAVMNTDALDALPGVPTIVQAGYAGATATSWSGIVVPAGTPADAVKKLADGLATVMRDGNTVGQFVALGSKVLVDMREGSFRDFIVAEQKKWGDVVRKSGAQLD